MLTPFKAGARLTDRSWNVYQLESTTQKYTRRKRFSWINPASHIYQKHTEINTTFLLWHFRFLRQYVKLQGKERVHPLNVFNILRDDRKIMTWQIAASSATLKSR